MDHHVEISQVIVDDGADSVLTTAHFVQIRRFILAQGQRKTYCAMFANNPYFVFQEFSFYLNPPDQKNKNCEPGKSEFNELVINVPYPATSPYTYPWLNIEFENGNHRLILKQYYCKKEGAVLLKECKELFQKALERVGAP